MALREESDGCLDGGAPSMTEKNVFERVMEPHYGTGEPGALITYGHIAAARDMAKTARSEEAGLSVSRFLACDDPQRFLNTSELAETSREQPTL